MLALRAALTAIRDQAEQALASLGTTSDAPPPLRRSGHLTRIERDPELRAFIDARLGTITQTDIILECRREFGAERAPSSAGLNRYVHILTRMEKEQSKY